MVTDHEDVLRHTLKGLEEDLEELRDLLMRQLDTFEGGLKTLVQELPVWLEMPYTRIQHLIKFPQDSSYKGALLGPRATALAASEIKHFIETWIGTREELADLSRNSQPNLSKPWGRDADLLVTYMDSLEHEAQAVMIAARTSLAHMRDEILAELEEQRKQDSEALEELVARGDLEQGNTARKELAELWEDQRRRADTFSRRWEKIERHIEQGLDITEGGLDTLREILENAEAGLAIAYPTQAAPEELVAEDAPSIKATTSPDLQVIPDTKRELADSPQQEDDFDPYGRDEEPDPRDRKDLGLLDLGDSEEDEELPKKKLNEDFFKSDEVNDDLVFADESHLAGPMIDFGDEDPGDGRASHQLFSTTLRTSSQTAPLSSSPYEIFLGDDSSAQFDKEPEIAPLTPSPVLPSPQPRSPDRHPDRRTPRPPSAALSPEELEPLRPPQITARVMDERQEEPEAPEERVSSTLRGFALAEEELQERPLVDEVAAQTETPVTTHTEPLLRPAIDVGDALRVEVSHSSTEPGPLVVDDIDSPTLPIMTSASGSEQDVAIVRAEVDDLDTPTLPAGLVSEVSADAILEAREEDAERDVYDEDALDVETVELDRHPASSPSPKTRTPDRKQAAVTPLASASRPASDSKVKEPAQIEAEAREESAEVGAPPVAKKPVVVHVGSTHEGVQRWQAEAHRRRMHQAPIKTLEKILAIGLPVALVALLVVQALMADAMGARWIVQSSVLRGVAFGACLWILLGPVLFLRWKFGWRGARPVVHRQQILLDDAELIIDGEQLEIGELVLAQDRVEEVSLERWQDIQTGNQGMVLRLRHGRPDKNHGATLVFVCTQLEDLEREGLLSEGLPWTEPVTWNSWKVSALTMWQIHQWGHEGLSDER